MKNIFDNPIVPGFAPDPSIVLVNGTFFLVNSSFHLFPGLPIYASKDLRSWTQIGNAINRPGQIDLSNAATDGFKIPNGKIVVAALGLFAPTIRFYKGTFYIVCTNCVRRGEKLFMQNFYVTTKDIWADEWSEPVYFEFQGIDTSLFIDEDDRAYIHGSWQEGQIPLHTCTIRQFEIDLSTGKALSDIKEIWDGFRKHDTEGPHIYEKDGYYYLLVAEAGTFDHHLIAIARSTNIWGPYESYEKNPILTADGTDNYIQNTGHGDLFQDGDGAWWITMLGVRNEDGRYPLGRETFLAPVSWPEGEWPQIELPKMQFEREQTSGNTPPENDLLSKARPRIGDLYIRNASLSDYAFSSDNRTITLVARSTDLSTPTGTTTFVGQRQRSLSCTATATLLLPASVSKSQEMRAGLALFKDDHRHITLSFDLLTSTIRLAHYDKLLQGGEVALAQVPLVAADITTREEEENGTNKVSFKITSSPRIYEFWYREEKGKDDSENEPENRQQGWSSLGSVDTLALTAWDFTGTIFGIFACSSSSSAAAAAVVDPPSVTFENFCLS